ncbi:MAG: hypothetical protein KDA75_15935 [Planctomycetaceae bacterium]|nr:hypothetical protein [Planctomycetaceae bacterium]
MRFTLVIAVFAASCLVAEDDREAPWRRLFDSIASEYQLLRDTEPDNASRLQLVPDPVYVWGRPQQQGSTYGAVYVWTHEGTAEAVACIWRYVNPSGMRAIVHETHSLSPVKIYSEGEFDTWRPRAGVNRRPIPEFNGQAAPIPAVTPAARLQQMRAIGRNFELNSVSESGDRTQLRLLPQPFHRSQSSDPAILDGALFAFVCSVGTDPEAFLQLTAVQTADGPQWHWSLARFSHHNLYASYANHDVWSAERDADNPITHNADHTYWMIHQSFTPSLLETPSTQQQDSTTEE